MVVWTRVSWLDLSAPMAVPIAVGEALCSHCRPVCALLSPLRDMDRALQCWAATPIEYQREQASNLWQ